MDELIKQVVSKAGINGEQAKSAVDAVIGFLKERLPGPIADQIEGLISGDEGAAKGLEDLAKGLGGLFGGDK